MKTYKAIDSKDKIHKEHANVIRWMKDAGEEYRAILAKMSKPELEEAFAGHLKFGTAGIRGVMGPGTNRMNKYTIIKATYGYAKFLLENNKNKENLSVVIGTDNRHNNDSFSKIAAEVLSSFGIKTYTSLVIPTPFVSFAIRDLKADGGIIVTASHNPKEYNGYKIYNSLGAQLLPDDSLRVSEISEEKEEFLSYKYTIDNSLMEKIPSETFDKYEKSILNLNYRNDEKNLKIVFSPQHGASAKFMPKYLEGKGYEVFPVKEQMTHDPDFSNTLSPNPELPAAYELGIKYLKKNNADIFITTDPDADRVGVAAYNGDKIEILNGNQTATLILDYVLKNSKLTGNEMIVYSYVSSQLPSLIAKEYGVKSVAVATGFKWMSHIIEKYKDNKFIFGFEESYGGMLDGNIARDKDSLQIGSVVAEMANYYKLNGLTLFDALENIYKKYTFVYDVTKTKEFKGINGNKDREAFMNNLRNNSKTLFDDDYNVIDLKDGLADVEPMNLVKFEFKSGSWFGARPSGTEPKIKFYVVVIAKNKQQLDKERVKIESYIDEIMKERG